MDTQTPKDENGTLREVGFYFLRLGATGFGGPLAVVAQMERDLAGRWLPRAEFAQAFAAIKTLPGPVAFQTVVFTAFRRGQQFSAPRLAATLAAFCFILPSASLMIFLGLTKTTWTHWTWTRSVLVGFQAAGLGIIISSVFALARSARVPTEYREYQAAAKWMFALFGFAVTLVSPRLEPFAIVLCGLFAMTPFKTRLFSITPLAIPAALASLSSVEIHTTLFLTCLKGGALVFGSGLAIVPLLGGEFVDVLQWMTHSEFLEALTFGQITPGPVMVTATFVGARVAGFTGGVIATIGIFLVPYIHMITWFPRLWDRLSRSQAWHRFSFGALSAVIGAILASSIKLLEPVVLAVLEVEPKGPVAQTAMLVTPQMATLGTWFLLTPLAFFLTHKKKQPAWAVVIGGGIISYLMLVRWI